MTVRDATSDLACRRAQQRSPGKGLLESGQASTAIWQEAVPAGCSDKRACDGGMRLCVLLVFRNNSRLIDSRKKLGVELEVAAIVRDLYQTSLELGYFQASGATAHFAVRCSPRLSLPRLKSAFGMSVHIGRTVNFCGLYVTGSLIIL